MNILIIAYAFAPNKRVGALRCSYWYKTLPEVLDCSVSVITAQTDAQGQGVHVVPAKGSSTMSKLVKDEGVVWKTNIKDYLETTTLASPDLVIISGGPFMHFGLTIWIQKKYGAKVILDYRDPFSINPGFENSSLKVMVKSFFEKRFNKKADALVTVNKYCSELVYYFDKKPNAIVQNGYDETVQPEFYPVNMKEPSFSYTGKFYFEPDPILDALEEVNLKLNHAGNDTIEMKDRKQDLIQSIGFVNYSKAVDLISKSDVGIIQTYGEDFQSTTKIFDYIRCARPILVVSNRYIERGSIHEELKGYPNVFWAKNSKQDIKDAIEKIQKSEYIAPPENMDIKFSRLHQMSKLVDLIQKLLND